MLGGDHADSWLDVLQVRASACGAELITFLPEPYINTMVYDVHTERGDLSKPAYSIHQGIAVLVSSARSTRIRANWSTWGAMVSQKN
mmetsp:Transcript_100312/g.312582  ORF Transcript_100312/g.312582 Transcript_100312/m.312582 type:complete len:87 (-) Transcript_100312:351-611(-)